MIIAIYKHCHLDVYMFIFVYIPIYFVRKTRDNSNDEFRKKNCSTDPIILHILTIIQFLNIVTT